MSRCFVLSSLWLRLILVSLRHKICSRGFWLIFSLFLCFPTVPLVLKGLACCGPLSLIQLLILNKLRMSYKKVDLYSDVCLQLKRALCWSCGSTLWSNLIKAQCNMVLTDWRWDAGKIGLCINNIFSKLTFSIKKLFMLLYTFVVWSVFHVDNMKLTIWLFQATLFDIAVPGDRARWISLSFWLPCHA